MTRRRVAVAAAAAAVVVALAATVALAQDDDVEKKKRSVWMPAEDGEYPYLCYVMRVEGDDRLPCVLIGTKFVAVHRVQLNYKDFADLQSLNSSYEVVAGMSVMPDDGDYHNLPHSQVQKVMMVFWEDPVVLDDKWSQFFLVYLRRSFKVVKGILDFAPMLLVSNWPLGHDELCTGLRWVHDNLTDAFTIHRMHFYVRRAVECSMTESPNFPLCTAGVSTRGLCQAEPDSVVVMCQRALLGWHARFDDDPMNPRASMKCGMRRALDPSEVPPEYLRALAPRRYLIYHWLTFQDKPISMPSMAPLWMPFRPPSESRPGGGKWWPPGSTPPRRPRRAFTVAALTAVLIATHLVLGRP